MKLLMKQKMFSWVNRFSIKDEYGNDKYQVEGELFSWGKKLHVYNLAGEEVAFIHQKVWSFLPRFFVYTNGREVAEIVKEFTFLKPQYSIEGLNWKVEGNFFAHDYLITHSGYQIVSIQKEWFTWGDFYTMDISNEQDEIIALAVVLAIDCVMASQRGAAGSSYNR